MTAMASAPATERPLPENTHSRYRNNSPYCEMMMRIRSASKPATPTTSKTVTVVERVAGARNNKAALINPIVVPATNSSSMPGTGAWPKLSSSNSGGEALTKTSRMFMLVPNSTSAASSAPTMAPVKAPAASIARGLTVLNGRAAAKALSSIVTARKAWPIDTTPPMIVRWPNTSTMPTSENKTAAPPPITPKRTLV